MVSRAKTGEKKKRVKIDKLKLNKETIKDLSVDTAKGIKGGDQYRSDGCGPAFSHPGQQGCNPNPPAPQGGGGYHSGSIILGGCGPCVTI